MDDGMAMCLRAWNDLEANRPVRGTGFGSIPWTVLRDWSTANGLDDENFELLVYAISVADRDRARRSEDERARNTATGAKR